MSLPILLDAKNEPESYVVKVENDSEEDEPDFHVVNKNPEGLLSPVDEAKKSPQKSLHVELGNRSKTIFQECKDTIRLASKATVDLEINIEMYKDDHVLENHFNNKSPASYNGILSRKEEIKYCTQNHFFKKLPAWIIRQLNVPCLTPVLFKFNSPEDLLSAQGNPFGSIAVAFLISQIGLYDVAGPKMFVTGFNQLYRSMFTNPPGEPEDKLPASHPARGFDCLEIDEYGEVELLKSENRLALYKSQSYNFVAQLPDSASDESESK